MGALTCAQASQAQVLLDDYSNPSPWTQVGVNMHLGSGVMKFDNVHDAADNRAYRSLAPNIPALDVTWKAEFEFNYISGNVPAHSLFCLSAGTLNAYRESPTGNFTDEDMLDIALIEPYYGNGNQAMVTVLRKDGNNAPTSVASSINLRPYNTYYFRIEKVASIKYLLSVYSDQDRTVHVAGSPFCFTVGTSIGGFNTIQHGCIIQGASSRSLNGTIDNLYIENGYNPAGNIGGDQTITFGGDPTAFLCNTGDGDYSWISATDPDGTWTLIPGANSACYDAPAGLTQTTFYRRRRLICGTYFYSNTVTVNVLDCTEEEDYSNAANWIQVDNGVCVSTATHKTHKRYRS